MKTCGEIVARNLLALGIVDRFDWPVIVALVAEAIRQDRDSAPRDEEDTLP